MWQKNYSTCFYYWATLRKRVLRRLFFFLKDQLFFSLLRFVLKFGINRFVSKRRTIQNSREIFHFYPKMLNAQKQILPIWYENIAEDISFEW